MPVSCALYDQLELYAIRKVQLQFLFNAKDGKTFKVIGKIKNLYVREGKEFLLLDSDQEYPLDNLVAAKAML